MKKYLLLLIAAVVSMPVFTACSDDDDTNRAQPVAITSGEIAAKNIFLFVDGKYSPHSGDITSSVSGSFNPATDTQGTLQLQTSAIFCLTESTDGFLSVSVPTIDLTVKKGDNNLTLAGDFTDHGYSYTVSGEIVGNHTNENDWILKIERTAAPSNSAIVGKTFEIDLTAANLAAVYTAGSAEQKQLCSSFLAELPGVFAENSEATAVRISFTDSESYTLSMKNAESGEFEDESTHMYYSQGNYINFIDDASFKESMAGNFNLKPIDIMAENSSANFAQQTMVCDVAQQQPMCVTTMQIVTNDASGLTLAWRPLDAKAGFMSQWSTPDPLETQSEKDFAALQTAEKDGQLAFTVNVTFKPVR